MLSVYASQGHCVLCVFKRICFVAKLSGHTALFRHKKFTNGVGNSVFQEHLHAPEHPPPCVSVTMALCHTKWSDLVTAPEAPQKNGLAVLNLWIVYYFC